MNLFYKSQNNMQNNFLNILIRWIVAVSAVMMTIAVSGCASVDANPQETVRKLANQRWQYLLAGQYDKAYEMTVPSYRKLKSKDHYTSVVRATPVKWKSAEVVKVDCETQSCKVVVKVVSQIMMPVRFKGPLESGSDETWVFEDGQWWMFETL